MCQLFKASGKKLDILHQEPLTRLFRFKMVHFEPEYDGIVSIFQAKQQSAYYKYF